MSREEDEYIEAVVTWQSKKVLELIQVALGVKATGEYDEATKQAITDFQRYFNRAEATSPPSPRIGQTFQRKDTLRRRWERENESGNSVLPETGGAT